MATLLIQNQGLGVEPIVLKPGYVVSHIQSVSVVKLPMDGDNPPVQEEDVVDDARLNPGNPG